MKNVKKKEIRHGACYLCFSFEDDECVNCLMRHKCKDATMDRELAEMQSGAEEGVSGLSQR